MAIIHRLRVNVKSLAAEAKAIREEEKRCGKVYRAELAEHRRGRVRAEARLAQLVLGFVRGRPYKSIEEKCYEKPNPFQLRKKAERHGVFDSEQKWIEWLTK